jgi:GntR family transcriptional regulator
MLSSSPIPLYFQIANRIETRISSGVYPIDALLPSEANLAKEFDVSLITVRGAMKHLIEKGLVERRPGKGTAVMRKTASYVWELGWLNDLVNSVLPSRLEMIWMKKVNPPDWVAEKFELPLPSGKIHAMRTIRKAVDCSDEPYMTTDLFFPPDIGAKLSREDFESTVARSKLAILTVEEVCDVSVESVRQTMTAEIADADTAELLRIDEGLPMLVVIRDYFDGSGRLVQTGRSRYRTDHYEYVLNVERNASPSGRKQPPRATR